jgi:hypothetical protein
LSTFHVSISFEQENVKSTRTNGPIISTGTHDQIHHAIAVKVARRCS